MTVNETYNGIVPGEEEKGKSDLFKLTSLHILIIVIICIILSAIIVAVIACLFGCKKNKKSNDKDSTKNNTKGTPKKKKSCKCVFLQYVFLFVCV